MLDGQGALIDEEGIAWTEAWNMCCKIFSYTNHTLMSEALETWPVDLMGRLLPRHLDIIFEINAYFLNALRAIGNFDDDFVRRVSIIDEKNRDILDDDQIMFHLMSIS